MRKGLLLALFALLCFSTGNAQEKENPFKVIRIDSVYFSNYHLLTESMGLKVNDSSDDKFRLGLIGYNMLIRSSEVVDKDAELPEDCGIYFSLVDETGNKIEYQSFDATSLLKKAKLLKLKNSGVSVSQLIFRGGEYNGVLSFPAIDYELHHNFTIYDDAIIRNYIGTEYEEKVDTTFRFFFYSGYPYDKSKFTGEEWAKCSVYSLDENKVPTLLSEKEINLTFKDATTETVELVDTLTMKVENAELGDYMVKLESNWTDNGNQEFYYTVLSSATAIRSIEDERVEESYTTLSGVKVAAPKSPGIYIRGKKKIVVK